MSYYDILFSPIGKQYCEYFKFLMFITFFGLMVTIITSVGHLLTSKNKHYGLPHLLAIVQAFLTYFVMRLFYSMCIQ